MSKTPVCTPVNNGGVHRCFDSMCTPHHHYSLVVVCRCAVCNSFFTLLREKKELEAVCNWRAGLPHNSNFVANG